MKDNMYVCMWCDKLGAFKYVECEDETEVKAWFHERVNEGFYNLNVFERNKENEG